MVKHTIDLSYKNNRKAKYYKALHDLNGVSDVVNTLLEEVHIPDIKK